MGSSNAILGPTPKSADTEAERSAAFTSGPWEWRTDDEMRRLAPGVLWLNDSPGSGGPWGDSIDRANARLIAAAPDQHEALRHQRTLTVRIMKALMATGRRDDLLLADEVHRADAANRTAIAKALGREAASPADAQPKAPEEP